MKKAKRLVAGMLIAGILTVVPATVMAAADNTACLCLVLDVNNVLWWVYSCYAYSPSDCSSPYGS